MNLLQLTVPFLPIMPGVRPPSARVRKEQKVVYTALVLFIYLVCCQIPLYGVLRSEGSDPFYMMRVILASNRGTLMELGLSPIISAGWILNILDKLKILKVDLSDARDRKLYEHANKMLAILLSLGQTLALILGGTYGRLQDLGYFNACLIFLQLALAGLMVILLDQFLECGYGLGSGVSLFIAVNTCEFIFWRTFSPVTLKTEYGTEFEGSVVALFHFLQTKPSVSAALHSAFFRTSAPNLSSVLATLVIFSAVIYLQGFKFKLRLVNPVNKGYDHDYPIKLFYTSTMAVILQSFFFSNISSLSLILYQRFQFSLLIRLVGVWQRTNGVWEPVGGISYFITLPDNIVQALQYPLRTLTSTLFVMASCGYFSKIWLELSPQNPSAVAIRLRDSGFSVSGRQEESLHKILKQVIGTAAVCGGMIIGLVTVCSQLLQAISSGTGLLITANIIYSYYDKIFNSK